MLLTVVAFLVSLVLSVLIEAWARPGRIVAFGPWPAVVLRWGVQAALFVAWFGLSWRPLHAGFASTATILVLVAISEAKRRFIGEPPVFSDFALVGQTV